MLEPIGDDAQCERLCGGEGRLSSGAICEHAGQIDDLRDPAAIILAIELDLELQAHASGEPSIRARRMLGATSRSSRMRWLVRRTDMLLCTSRVAAMSQWKAARARQVLAALLRIGWAIKRTTGSHRVLERAGWQDYAFAFHDADEIGPVMLSRIGKRTGLMPDDL